MNRAVLCVWLVCLLLLTAGCTTTPPQDRVDNQAAAQANARLGLDFLSKGRYERARKRLQRALRYDSSNVLANWGMALLYQNLDRPEKARHYYARIVDDHLRPAIVNSYAVFLCEQGKTEQAIDYFKRAANDYRNDSPAVALANAGLCLKRAGQPEKAKRYYRKALSINENQPTALTRMARIQYQQGHYLSARAFIQRADEVIELSPKILLLAARIELALGERDAARYYLQRHNKSKPGAALTFRQFLEQSK